MPLPKKGPYCKINIFVHMKCVFGLIVFQLIEHIENVSNT